MGTMRAHLALALAGVVGLLLCLPTAARAGEAVSLTFTATGMEQTYVVPAGVTSVSVRAVGARGYGGGAPAVVSGASASARAVAAGAAATTAGAAAAPTGTPIANAGS